MSDYLSLKDAKHRMEVCLTGTYDGDGMRTLGRIQVIKALRKAYDDGYKAAKNSDDCCDEEETSNWSCSTSKPSLKDQLEMSEATVKRLSADLDAAYKALNGTRTVLEDALLRSRRS